MVSKKEKVWLRSWERADTCYREWQSNRTRMSTDRYSDTGEDSDKEMNNPVLLGVPHS